ncbi:MAG: hypothetical protein AAGE94_16485 [Acidobacteriota bacterium]
MTPVLLRLDRPALDPAAAARLATGDAVGVMLPGDARSALPAVARQVRSEAAHAASGGVVGPPLIAVELDAWGAASAAPGFDLASHVAELAAGGEPLEVLLAAVATGRSLAEAGLNAVLGPDLSTCIGEPSTAIETAVGVLVEGLQAAGMAVGLRGLPLDVDATDSRWRLWGVAFAAGLDWLVVDGAAESLASTLTILREDLGFDGLVVASSSAAVPDDRIDVTLVDVETTVEQRPLIPPEVSRRVLAWRLDVLD